MANQIILFRGPQGWMARYTGEHAAGIRDVFQTDCVPTAFTIDADSFDVQNEIAKRNPGVTVKVELSTR